MTGIQHAALVATVLAMPACEAPPPAHEQRPATSDSSPASPVTSERRSFANVDICQLIPGPAVATALGGRFASSLRRSGFLETSGCVYTIELSDGSEDVVLLWLAPPEDYEMLKSLEQDPVQTLVGLGDDAYGRQETPEVAEVHAVKKGQASIEATASRVSDARKLAEVALAHLR